MALNGYSAAFQPVSQEAEYQVDDRGLFCRHCGRTSIRHFPWHGKRLCDLPKKEPAHD